MSEEPIFKRKTSVWLLILGTILIILGFTLGGCIRLTDEAGKAVAMTNREGQLMVELKDVPVENKAATKLKALVKGSIYESGEAVSVFGSCLDGYDQPVAGSYAFLTTWYPNGTMQYPNITMVEFSPSYFVYTGTMDVVPGTYLTELTCYVANTSLMAKAFGEWQNPYWVARIANISNQLANLSFNMSGINVTFNFSGTVNVNFTEIIDILSNISGQIGNLSEQVANISVNLTPIIETMNEQYSNLTVLITELNGNLSVQITQGFNDLNASTSAQFLNLSTQLIDITYLLQEMNTNMTTYFVNVTNTLVNISDQLYLLSIVSNSTYALLNQTYILLQNVSSVVNLMEEQLYNVSLIVNGMAYNISVTQDMLLAMNLSNYVWHNTTWGMITQMNQTNAMYFQNLSQQITQVGVIANASVDRNDSLLALLLLNLTRCTSCANMTGMPLNYTETHDPPYYMRTWSIRVDAFSPLTGQQISYPDGACDIMTKQTAWTPMTPQGEHFIYSEQILSLGDWTFNVSCYWT